MKRETGRLNQVFPDSICHTLLFHSILSQPWVALKEERQVCSFIWFCSSRTQIHLQSERIACSQSLVKILGCIQILYIVRRSRHDLGTFMELYKFIWLMVALLAWGKPEVSQSESLWIIGWIQRRTAWVGPVLHSETGQGCNPEFILKKRSKAMRLANMSYDRW